MFKKKVGRPSNKYLRRKRNLRLFGLGLIVIAISVIFVKLSAFLSGDNAFKLSGMVSWTQNGYKYICPYGYTQSLTKNDDCVKIVSNPPSTCDYTKNKDNSYKNYILKSDSNKCEKKVSGKHVTNVQSKTATKIQCGVTNNGTYANGKCYYCSSGVKPVYVNGKYKCTACPSNRKERTDGCYDQKDPKLYCTGNGKIQGTSCVYTAKATSYKISNSKANIENIVCNNDGTVTFDLYYDKSITPNWNITNYIVNDGTRKNQIGARIKVPTNENVSINFSDGSGINFNPSSSCTQVRANQSSQNESSNSSSSGSSSTQAKTYKITYHPNGAKGNDWSETATYGQNYKTYDNWYKRAGHTFKGWNESPYGDGVDWTAWINKDWTWTYDKNVELYAQWEKNKYTVTYHANGAPGEDYTDNIMYGNPYYTWENWYKRDGYIFTGWNEKADGTGVNWTSYINKAWTWTYTKNVELYAQWKKTTHNEAATASSITSYGWRGGKFYEHGKIVKDAFIETSQSVGNYVYVGSDGNMSAFEGKGASTDMWTWIKGTGNNKNKWWFGKTGVSDSYLKGKTYKICGYSSSRRTCESYVFDPLGWCTSDVTEKTTTKNTSSFASSTSSADTKTQATQEKYTITYHANGGTGKEYTETVIYGSKYKTWWNWFKKDGYIFNGWNEKKNGTGVNWTEWIDKEWTWTYKKNVNLYAQWRKDTTGSSNNNQKEANNNNQGTTYSITYHANGGKGKDYTDHVNYQENYVTWENWYKRDGYTFKGWNESPDGKGVDWTNWINKGWIWTYKKNVNLYAQWKKSTTNTSSTPKYGWYNGKFYNNGKPVKSTYVERGQQDGYYVYMNKNGNLYNTDLYAWLKGQGSNSNKWWFSQMTNGSFYPSGKKITVCGYSKSRRMCKEFEFDSSGWCSSGNYKCNW